MNKHTLSFFSFCCSLWIEIFHSGKCLTNIAILILPSLSNGTIIFRLNTVAFKNKKIEKYIYLISWLSNINLINVIQAYFLNFQGTSDNHRACRKQRNKGKTFNNLFYNFFHYFTIIRTLLSNIFNPSSVAFVDNKNWTSSNPFQLSKFIF